MAVSFPSSQSHSIIATHHPVGASTGYMDALREDWPAQVAEAMRVSPFAIELSALSENELAGLDAYMRAEYRLPFRYLSIHGPSKARTMPEADLVDRLRHLAAGADAVVMHPDTIKDPHVYRPLGRKLVLENMDDRKASGRTVEELEPLFDEVPEAGFCFDIAHAWSVDSSMDLANELLNAFGQKLRHVHLSSLSPESHHVPLNVDDEDLFRPLLARCLDVPWILEAPPRVD